LIEVISSSPRALGVIAAAISTTRLS